MKASGLLFLAALFCLFTGCTGREAAPDSSVPADTTPVSATVPGSTSVQTAAAATTAQVTTPAVYGDKLNEEGLAAAFLRQKPGAVLLGIGRTLFPVYAFYRHALGDDILIDRLHPSSGEILQENVLAGQGSYRIYGFSAQDFGVYELTVYMTGTELLPEEMAELPIFPGEYRLVVEDGITAIRSIDREKLFLPPTMDGFYRGNGWAKPVLTDCRVGFDQVAFRFEALPGGERTEGGEAMPVYRADYDQEANELVLTLSDTTLAAPLAVAEGNAFVRSVRIAAEGSNIKVTIALAEDVGWYAQTFQVLWDGRGESAFGVLTYYFQAGHQAEGSIRSFR